MNQLMSFLVSLQVDFSLFQGLIAYDCLKYPIFQFLRSTFFGEIDLRVVEQVEQAHYAFFNEYLVDI